MTTSSALALPSSGVPADTLVLANRPLVAGFDLASTSRFADDSWDLSPAVHMRHVRKMTLNFLSVPTRFQQVVKELMFALLRNDHPYGQPDVRIQTVRGRFTNIKLFLAWADARDVSFLSSLGVDDFTAYNDHLSTRRLTSVTASSMRGTVRLLWVYRSKLTADTLTVDPNIAWDQRRPGATNSRHARSRENTTDRIPEEVLSPLLTWSLRWVETFADDILRAHDEWLDLRAAPKRAAAGGRGLLGGLTAKDRVTALLDSYRREQRPLPGAAKHPFAGPGKINKAHLAREARVQHEMFQRAPYSAMLRTTEEAVGIDDATYLRAEPRAQLDGFQWIHRVPWDAIETYTRLLQTACYVVVAYLSGMRDSEIKHMRTGCASVWRDEEDRPVRYRITSLAFKGEESVEGTEATWIVNASVITAVEALERLQRNGSAYLFALQPASRAHTKVGNDRVQTSGTTQARITEFMRWVNAYCAAHGRDDGIPVMRIQTRQFRRTLAWHIARQPGGSIAGAMQYRHQSLQMFEGYAGTSASGFRPEVEAEQALARGEKLGDVILNPSPHKITGPAAEEAETRLAAFAQDIEFLGKVITDRKRLARYMSRHDPHIYPGEFVTCVYNPDRALCRPNDGDGPSLTDCQPLRCRNVALTVDNIRAHRGQQQRLDTELAGGEVLAPYYRARLEANRDEIVQFLESNDCAQTEEPRS